jgi:hypothetical protein
MVNRARWDEMRIPSSIVRRCARDPARTKAGILAAMRSTTPARSPSATRVPLAWLVTGWLVAGTLDISYATGFSYWRSGTPPARILQSVASGLLGADAYQGGASTAALGVALQNFFSLNRRKDVLACFWVLPRAVPPLA